MPAAPPSAEDPSVEDPGAEDPRPGDSRSGDTRDGAAAGQARGAPARGLLAELGVALIPAVVVVGVWPIAAPGAAGRFQATLAGMVAIVSVASFTFGSGIGSGPRRLLVPVLPRLAAAAGLAGLVYAVLSGDARAGAGVAFLYLGVAAAASGLAALGRVLGTPSVAAGAVAACVLWIAMTGLFWADPLAEHLDRRERRPFRQAVLHVDPALALSYDGVGYDRLRSTEVYFDVPLASSFYDRPKAGTTGSLWLATGLVAWGAALLVWHSRRRSPQGQGAARPGPTAPCP